MRFATESKLRIAELLFTIERDAGIRFIFTGQRLQKTPKHIHAGARKPLETQGLRSLNKSNYTLIHHKNMSSAEVNIPAERRQKPREYRADRIRVMED